ncbi:MAG: arginine N-succinyltransferase [Steroidobacteraceae bacterium]|jgi:arginine N-succinyltransferase|nr:arginine N-succinyltransferase [Steroidobacteraceae bacterium]
MSSTATPIPFRLRPAGPADLPGLERFAQASAHGITTLPPDRAALAARLERSARAFEAPGSATGDEIHLFVVEDLARRRLVGTAGIAANAGSADRFYAFRNEFVVHSSPALGVTNRVHTLRLCDDLTGVTLLTSFYVEPEYADTLAPQLLSRGRLLFVAQFAERFSERIAAESPGLADDAGRCPFWDAVGRRFFGMDYPAIERLAVGRSKAFIPQLMPAGPVYVPLLPEEAQWAIGQLHPVGELPFAILADEGFDPDSYVDLFDGGPIGQARVADLKSVSGSRVQRLAELAARLRRRRASTAGAMLVANTRREGFRAVCVGPPDAAGGAPDTAALAELLGVGTDAEVRGVPLAPAAARER